MRAKAVRGAFLSHVKHAAFVGVLQHGHRAAEADAGHVLLIDLGKKNRNRTGFPSLCVSHLHDHVASLKTAVQRRGLPADH